MADKNAPKKESNVISLADSKCVAEGCKHKSARAGFCNEHYTWFKEGLLTIEGYHAKDFDKKHALYMARIAGQTAKKAA